jgi:hypothetical protein
MMISRFSTNKSPTLLLAVICRTAWDTELTTWEIGQSYATNARSITGHKL